MAIVFSPRTYYVEIQHAAMRDLSVLQPKRLMEWPVSVNLYTDATSHSMHSDWLPWSRP